MSEPQPPLAIADAEWGLVCALKIEINPLLSRLENARSIKGGAFTFRGGKMHGKKLAIVEAGAGAKRAERATHALIDAHAPRWLLSAGFSGGLIEDLRVGDLVVANALQAASGDETLTLDLHMAPDPRLRLYIGKLAMSNHIVRTIEEKRTIHARTGALAVDMESLAVARVCRERKVRFMAVRVISDDMSVDLPAEILSIVGAKGTIRAGAVVEALWNRPSSLFDMLHLRERANSAAERLALCLTGVLKVLAETP